MTRSPFRLLAASLQGYGVLTIGAASIALACFQLRMSLTVMMGAVANVFLITLIFPAGRNLLGLPRIGRVAGSRVADIHGNVLIYGAGTAGERVVRYLRVVETIEPVAFVDDAADLHQRRVAGLPVYAAKDVPHLVHKFNIRRIVLAMPRATRKRRQEILSTLEPLRVHVLSLPELTEASIDSLPYGGLRDIAIEDLLGRDAVPPNPKLLEASIRDKVVLVTGAGGSIGSELCRQIVRCGPKRLVLVEMSELALYCIRGELRDLLAVERISCDVVPVLLDVRHRKHLKDTMRKHGIHTVYHSAAYKHVPIVEGNVISGASNNVMGTLHAAEAALETGVERFVLVSTDKAVHPTNVMGATKRLAELIVIALQYRSDRTKFCVIRFGNVLASSGSVVPLFREQIRRGGPITVTHPDVIRYFMTTYEAAQLVIQAGSMARSGEIFLMDMGRPVRIDDLARRMVSLMGLTIRDQQHPDGDIEIEYTGLRTAEKLFEELLIGTNIVGTDHPMVMRAIEQGLSWGVLERVLADLTRAIEEGNGNRIVALLREAVPQYVPSAQTLEDLDRDAADYAEGTEELGPKLRRAGFPLRLVSGGDGRD